MEKPQRVTEKCFKHIDTQRKIAVSQQYCQRWEKERDGGGQCDNFIKEEKMEKGDK